MVILTRNSGISYLNTVTVAPISSTVRGVPSEVALDVADGMKGVCAINLHNAITLPQTKLLKRVGSLSPARMREVCKALHFALGCEE